MGNPDFRDKGAEEPDLPNKIKALFAEIIPANPFYADKFAKSGVVVDHIHTLRDFTEKIPFTTKEELIHDQKAHPPYGTNLTYPLIRYSRYSQTSATTGSPMRWLDTSDDWAWMLENWKKVYAACGVGNGDRCFFAFSFGPFLGFWTAFEAATELGCLCIPGGGMRSVARLRAILDNEITVICCTPTYALHLGQTARSEGIDLGQLRVQSIIVAGEHGGSIPATRQQIEDHWPGAKVRDHHGMTEVGPVSYPCPANDDMLHIIESSYYAELVDSDSARVLPFGSTGELVLTTLGRTGSPLIRYRTGDLVRFAPSRGCACGSRDIGLCGGILSRIDDMTIIRGVNVYPAAVDAVVRKFREIEEYQVEIESSGGLNEMTVVIEPGNPDVDVDDLTHRLTNEINVAFNLRIGIQVVDSGCLPRYELKAKRWNRKNRIG